MSNTYILYVTNNSLQSVKNSFLFVVPTFSTLMLKASKALEEKPLGSNTAFIYELFFENDSIRVVFVCVFVVLYPRTISNLMWKYNHVGQRTFDTSV